MNKYIKRTNIYLSLKLFSFSYLIFASDNFRFPSLFFATVYVVLSIVKDPTRVH